MEEKQQTKPNPRDVGPRKALGSLHQRIKEARVLMVGAGGIGCELLKNLVLTGFGEIHIVDLDTIDLSNLNRQFLFGMQHIKKSKAMVAKETAGKFNPNVKLHAHHANIKDAEFNIKWYKGFNLVFNALDNLDARRHVNKMCLAADVPLVESGTTGFNGQVQVIKKGVTECYDCTPKPVPKSFPVCTIRSTPSQPIHCIVWAKSYLFTEIFGTSEDDSPEFDHTKDAENAQEIEALRRESQELKKIREQIGTDSFARSIFEKVFTRDIQRLCGMEDMWKRRKAPTALDYDTVETAAKGIPGHTANMDQKIWSLEENFVVFVDSLQRLSKRVQELHAEDGDKSILSFDKDDVDTLDFVAAAANLRSHVFGIELKSKFDIKQMAGNIIPAIATTNAITAGVCVLQAFKVLRQDLSSAQMVFLSRSSERVFSTEKLSAPNLSCDVCGVARATVEVDLSRATLDDLIEGYLKKGLGYGDEISILTDQLLYDPDFDDNVGNEFTSMGVEEGTFITVMDDNEEEGENGEILQPRVNLVLAVVNKEIEEDQDPIVPPEEGMVIPRKVKQVEAAPAPQEAHGAAAGAGMKRMHEDMADSNCGAKKRKLDDATAELSIKDGRRGKGKMEVVEVDDSGVIEID
ncbi:ubiquitin-activating enzyme [Terfezia boudieri ATCC MYA-4762]|uniref:Ubiquitin-activating enzyme E1-like n=1 Tax=Terfezia boudieri ATCC MYA-4762 TaxID=1051890 RepID=A0A3N4LAD3_9PEZI|nr:ubiquitin-activating enzyme [Terfezia boudieri ATCC MYA-4762]